MIDGECSLGILNNGRIYDVVQKGAKIGIEWNQNLQSVDYLVVPKARASRMRQWADRRDDGAGEPGKVTEYHAAGADESRRLQVHQEPEVAPWLSTETANASQGFPINEEYWRDNYKRLQSVGQPGSSREWQTRKSPRFGHGSAGNGVSRR